MGIYQFFTRLLCIVCISSLLISCASGDAIPEQLTTPKARTSTPLSSMELLRAFEADVEETMNYTLGAGDEITVDVWGYDKLSGKHIIGPDGKITVPLSGTVHLAQLDRDNAAQLIHDKLKDYYNNLSVTVRVDNYASNRILVLGRIEKPGELKFGMSAPNLLEAIALAGGVSTSDGLTASESLKMTRCAIFRGKDKVVWVEIAPLLRGENLALNLKLKRNDVVYVSEIEEKLVYVLGEVRSPGALRLTSRMSFLEAIAKAGGPTIDAAPNRIQLIRPDEEINQSLALDDVISATQAPNYQLEEGDIIYVPTNTIAKLNYAIRFLTPFSSVLGIYANVESIRADSERRKLEQERDELQDQIEAFEEEKAANTGLE